MRLRLEPEVAAAKFERGEQMIVPIEQVAVMFKMTPEEFRPFLASGELHGYVLEASLDGRSIRVGLDLQEVKTWMVRHNIGDGGKPLDPRVNRLQTEAAWKAKATEAGPDIEIPAAFMRSLTETDWRQIRLTGALNRGQCVRLWEMQRYPGPAPESVTLFVNGDDVERLVAEEKARRNR